MEERFITVAIHTYEKAVALRALLESEGIAVEFRNVNISQPVVSSGIRVRIKESDLPLALRVIENQEIFRYPSGSKCRIDDVKPVVVPIDFSEKSFNAAVTAFSIAARHGAEIVLLHAYIDPYVAGNLQLTDSMSYEIAELEDGKQIKNVESAQMRHFAGRLRDMIKQGSLPAVKFTTKIVEGVPEDAIADYARENTPLLIVMATRGAEKKEIDLIGSVTAEVLDKCRFSVLALPETSDNKVYSSHFTNILFFSNVDQQDILAIDTLHRALNYTGVKVTIATLPIKKRPFARTATQAVNSLADYCRHNFKGYTFEQAEISADKPLDDIKRLEQDQPFDIIVVPNKKKNVFSRLFSPTLAHKILLHTNIPLFVIPV